MVNRCETASLERSLVSRVFQASSRASVSEVRLDPSQVSIKLLLPLFSSLQSKDQMYIFYYLYDPLKKKNLFMKPS